MTPGTLYLQPSRSRAALVFVLALLGAAAVNVIIFFMLTLMNGQPIMPPPAAEQPRIVVLADSPAVKTAAKPNADPGGSPAPDEPMTINLDAPPPVAPTITEPDTRPVEVNVKFDMPDVAPIAVNVIATPVPAPSPIKVAAPKRSQDDLNRQMLEELGLAPRGRNTGPSNPLGAGGVGSGTGSGVGAGTGTGAPSADSVEHPPRPIRKPQTAYPAFARKAGIEGSVTVKILIDTTGHVSDVEVLDVIGHDSFRQAVLDVVKTWEFTPATHHGKVVSVWGISKVTFTLEK